MFRFHGLVRKHNKEEREREMPPERTHRELEKSPWKEKNVQERKREPP
jgi:hypothetical protein